ncbi:MAG: AAA family ATPase, partial [Leptolyngbyaceae cyanobacterium SL_7_1]|nr:AAA family ATPase [Leptolyngbyaceae cyanobacterium SL_7_1]
MKEELSVLIQAQYPLIYLVTSEEERAEQTISAIAQVKPQRRVFLWTVTHGIVEYGQPRNVTQHNTVSPQTAIEWVIRQREPGIFVFKDLHPFIDNAEVTRWLRDAIAGFKDTHKTIVLMSPLQNVPIELEKEVAVLDYPLPDMAELNQVLTQHLDQLRTPRKITTETREKLLKAALGLTRDEADKVYRKAQVTAGRLTEAEVDVVLSEKKQLIRRNGILEYIEEDSTIDSVGGLEELK